MTLNIGCHRGHLISATTWRVSEECWSGVWIGGYRVQRGLQATFGGGGGLGVIFRGSVGWGVGVEGVCSSVGDCWKGLGIRSTLKCFWNSEVVGVWRMPKVSEVRVGKTPRCFWNRKQVIPWQEPAENLMNYNNTQWVQGEILLLNICIFNQYKNSGFCVFLFDGFLAMCKMYAHMTKHSIQVRLHGVWLSAGIDVHLQHVSVR